MKNNSANGKWAMENGQPPKVAIVCDWLTDIGGAELVLLELHKMFPDAPIYTSQYNPKRIDWFTDAEVRTGWLQAFPSFLKKLLPVLRAWYFSHLNLSEYDLIISSNTGAEAKGIRLRHSGKWKMENGKSQMQKPLHLCYMHAPTHYYWSRYDEYLQNPGWGVFDWLGRLGLKLLIGPMRKWDYKAAQRPDYIIANSTHTQAQIKKYYGRDSTVIFPPVDTDRFSQLPNTKYDLPQNRSGFVITGRQTPYKRIDLAVAACTKLSLPLTVIGSGPDHEKLKKMAGPTITFLGHVAQDELPKHLHAAQAFIFPGLDDFGIAPVEALAAGTPVIAYRGGGALDYVIEGKTGMFFDEQTVESLCGALQAFNHRKYFNSDIKLAAKKFSNHNFRQLINKYIKDVCSK
jgi:glycosyltransferase involved in cell wall biosynthesis